MSKIEGIKLNGTVLEIETGSNVDIHIEDDTLVINTDGTSSGGSGNTGSSGGIVNLLDYYDSSNYNNNYTQIFFTSELSSIVENNDKFTELELMYNIPDLGISGKDKRSISMYQKDVLRADYTDIIMIFGAVSYSTNLVGNIIDHNVYFSKLNNVLYLSIYDKDGRLYQVLTAYLSGQVSGELKLELHFSN